MEFNKSVENILTVARSYSTLVKIASEQSRQVFSVVDSILDIPYDAAARIHSRLSSFAQYGGGNRLYGILDTVPPTGAELLPMEDQPFTVIDSFAKKHPITHEEGDDRFKLVLYDDGIQYPMVLVSSSEGTEIRYLDTSFFDLEDFYEKTKKKAEEDLPAAIAQINRERKERNEDPDRPKNQPPEMPITTDEEKQEVFDEVHAALISDKVVGNMSSDFDAPNGSLGQVSAEAVGKLRAVMPEGESNVTKIDYARYFKYPEDANVFAQIMAIKDVTKRLAEAEQFLQKVGMVETEEELTLAPAWKFVELYNIINPNSPYYWLERARSYAERATKVCTLYNKIYTSLIVNPLRVKLVDAQKVDGKIVSANVLISDEKLALIERALPSAEEDLETKMFTYVPDTEHSYTSTVESPILAKEVRKLKSSIYFTKAMLSEVHSEKPDKYAIAKVEGGWKINSDMTQYIEHIFTYADVDFNLTFEAIVKDQGDSFWKMFDEYVTTYESLMNDAIADGVKVNVTNRDKLYTKRGHEQLDKEKAAYDQFGRLLQKQHIVRRDDKAWDFPSNDEVNPEIVLDSNEIQSEIEPAQTSQKVKLLSRALLEKIFIGFGDSDESRKSLEDIGEAIDNAKVFSSDVSMDITVGKLNVVTKNMHKILREYSVNRLREIFIDPEANKDEVERISAITESGKDMAGFFLGKDTVKNVLALESKVDSLENKKQEIETYDPEAQQQENQEKLVKVQGEIAKLDAELEADSKAHMLSNEEKMAIKKRTQYLKSVVKKLNSAPSLPTIKDVENQLVSAQKKLDDYLSAVEAEIPSKIATHVYFQLKEKVMELGYLTTWSDTVRRETRQKIVEAISEIFAKQPELAKQIVRECLDNKTHGYKFSEAKVNKFFIEPLKAKYPNLKKAWSGQISEEDQELYRQNQEVLGKIIFMTDVSGQEDTDDTDDLGNALSPAQLTEEMTQELVANTAQNLHAFDSILINYIRYFAKGQKYNQAITTLHNSKANFRNPQEFLEQYEAITENFVIYVASAIERNLRQSTEFNERIKEQSPRIWAYMYPDKQAQEEEPELPDEMKEMYLVEKENNQKKVWSYIRTRIEELVAIYNQTLEGYDDEDFTSANPARDLVKRLSVLKVRPKAIRSIVSKLRNNQRLPESKVIDVISEALSSQNAQPEVESNLELSRNIFTAMVETRSMLADSSGRYSLTITDNDIINPDAPANFAADKVLKGTGTTEGMLLNILEPITAVDPELLKRTVHTIGRARTISRPMDNTQEKLINSIIEEFVKFDKQLSNYRSAAIYKLYKEREDVEAQKGQHVFTPEEIKGEVLKMIADNGSTSILSSLLPNAGSNSLKDIMAAYAGERLDLISRFEEHANFMFSKRKREIKDEEGNVVSVEDVEPTFPLTDRFALVPTEGIIDKIYQVIPDKEGLIENGMTDIQIKKMIKRKLELLNLSNRLIERDESGKYKDTEYTTPPKYSNPGLKDPQYFEHISRPYMIKQKENMARLDTLFASEEKINCSMMVNIFYHLEAKYICPMGRKLADNNANDEAVVNAANKLFAHPSVRVYQKSIGESALQAYIVKRLEAIRNGESHSTEFVVNNITLVDAVVDSSIRLVASIRENEKQKRAQKGTQDFAEYEANAREVADTSFDDHDIDRAEDALNEQQSIIEQNQRIMDQPVDPAAIKDMVVYLISSRTNQSLNFAARSFLEEKKLQDKVESAKIFKTLPIVFDNKVSYIDVEAPPDPTKPDAKKRIIKEPVYDSPLYGTKGSPIVIRLAVKQLVVGGEDKGTPKGVPLEYLNYFNNASNANVNSWQDIQSQQEEKPNDVQQGLLEKYNPKGIQRLKQLSNMIGRQIWGTLNRNDYFYVRLVPFEYGGKVPSLEGPDVQDLEQSAPDDIVLYMKAYVQDALSAFTRNGKVYMDAVLTGTQLAQVKAAFKKAASMETMFLSTERKRRMLMEVQQEAGQKLVQEENEKAALKEEDEKLLQQAQEQFIGWYHMELAKVSSKAYAEYVKLQKRLREEREVNPNTPVNPILGKEFNVVDYVDLKGIKEPKQYDLIPAELKQSLKAKVEREVSLEQLRKNSEKAKEAEETYIQTIQKLLRRFPRTRMGLDKLLSAPPFGVAPKFEIIPADRRRVIETELRGKEIAEREEALKQVKAPKKKNLDLLEKDVIPMTGEQAAPIQEQGENIDPEQLVTNIEEKADAHDEDISSELSGAADVETQEQSAPVSSEKPKTPKSRAKATNKPKSKAKK